MLNVGRVRLDMWPADHEFAGRHPELGHHARHDGRYQLPMGHTPAFIAPLDQALLAFAPDLYGREAWVAEFTARTPRPRAVTASVAIVASLWCCAAGFGFFWAGTRETDHRLLGGGACWTVALAIWLYRVLRGGPMALRRLTVFTTTVGVVFLIGTLTFGVLLVGNDPGVAKLSIVPAFAPGVVGGGLLLVSGRLLARTDVKAWARSNEIGAGGD